MTDNEKLADEYEAGLRKMEAAGYEEFAEVIPKHKLIIAALRSQRDGEPDYTSWLIEMSERLGPVYFQMVDDNDWTKDQDAACHFARKQDAEHFIKYYGWTRARAVEHMWPELSSPQPPTAPPPNREALRKLVDVVWNEATESTAVPSTKWADKLIDKVFKSGPDQTNPQMMMMMMQMGQMQGDSLDKALRGGRNVVVVPDDRTGTLVITGPGASLKIIDKIIESLDANETVSAEVRIFTLKFADADIAAKLVTDMFKADEKDNNNNPYRIFFYGMPQEDNAGGKTPKVIATADYRTGTLVVTATPLQMKIIAEVLLKIDSDHKTASTFFLHRLKNGQAVKLQVVLNTLFGVGAENGGGNGQQQGNPNGQQPGNFNGQQGGNGSAIGSRGRSGGTGGGGQFATGSGGTGIGSRRTNRNGNGNSGRPNLSSNASHMIGEMAGEVFVVADEDTNSLLVTTASKFREQVKQIIEELDRPVPQVLIKVLVAEVTHDNSEDLGVDFSILNRRANGRGPSFGSSLGTAAVTGGLVVNLIESDINVTLRALATAGKLDVLSRPYILASDNQLASITVGQEVPFITDTRIDSLGGQIHTIQYQDVGIILQVTPHINPDGLVIMDVTPEISQLTSSTVPISQGVSAPIISKRSADSRVGIRDGQTIVIGGLMEDRKTSTMTKVPILGDIPFIGALFQRNQVQKSKTELLIFLTPHVAQQPESLQPMSQDELKGTKLTPGAVEPGTFDEQIRGLQRGAGPVTKPTTKPTP